MYSTIQKISINGNVFHIHEYLLKEISAFEYLFDTSVEIVPTNLEITDVTKSEIEYVFSFLYAKYSYFQISLFMDGKQTVATFSKIIKIMMVMGIKECLINIYVLESIKFNDNFLSELINEVEYQDFFPLVVNMYVKKHDVSYIKSMASVLVGKKFPNEFGLKILSKLISGIYTIKDFDFVLAVTGYYENLDLSCRKILSVFSDSFSPLAAKKIEDIYKNFFDMDIAIRVDDSDLKMIEFVINDKPINIIQNNTITKGTIGTNMLETIAIHISEILLGIKQL